MKIAVRPWLVTLVVYAAYLASILFSHAGDPLAFVRLGFAPNEGYDGQFTYLIAIDPNPATAVREIQEVRADIPAYRYQRILLPMLARTLGFGQPALIVWLIPLINVIAQVIGVAIVEQLLVRLGVSHWYALVYAFWPGLAVAVRADLTEPLSYTLVAAAYLLHWHGRPWFSALCLGLAMFAKETALLFVVAQLAHMVLTHSWRAAISLTGVSLLPFILWQFILHAMFGAFGIGSGGYLGTPFEIIPFNGVWRILPEQGPTVFAIFLLFLGPWVIVPSVWGIIASARHLFKRDWHHYGLALAVNAAIIPFTPFSTFREPVSMFRFCTGLVMATLLFGGLTKSRRVLNYSWLWLAMLAFLVKD